MKLYYIMFLCCFENVLIKAAHEITYERKKIKLENLDSLLQEDDSSPESLLTMGHLLLEQDRSDEATVCFTKAWQKGNFQTRWHAYKGFEKIVFPDESRLDPSERKYLEVPNSYKKAYIFFYFLKDIIWP